MTGIALLNAATSAFGLTTLRIEGAKIASVGEPPRHDDQRVDLAGDQLLPGLINAHDHLQLNNLGRQSANKPYVHIREWIAEVGKSRSTDAALASNSAVDRDARLLIGGLKNLLCGVTCVAHHDPSYPFLSDPHFPTRIVQRFGWAHSLYLDGRSSVIDSYRNTPPEWPWIIHAAEGLNREAALEFDTLDEIGCLGTNSLLVHGIALDHSRRERLAQVGAGLIWCPCSNITLFGKTAEVGRLLRLGRVALGTDSRLSGANDLLAELQLAHRLGGIDTGTLETLVTGTAAKLLRLDHQGTLEPGALADILVLPQGKSLAHVSRRDIRLVMIDGIPRYADASYAQLISPACGWTPVRVDEAPKHLAADTAELLTQFEAHEPGLELTNLNWRAA
jgi:cytosine/adenosine deaminase-related metal-dependent hydrolase